MGANFTHNMAFLDRDMETMHSLGINTMGVFIPDYAFFNKLEPVNERFDQLNTFLDRVRQGGLRAVLLDLFPISQETWCAERGVDPGAEQWHPAVHPEAEQAAIYMHQVLRPPFAGRPEIIGWVTDVGRFFDYKFTVPPVRETWSAWLRRRFDWDFDRVRELFSLALDENTWDRVRMPTEMEPYFNRENPRSYEFALMQQSLCTKGTNRQIKAVRPFTPNHLQFSAMEGCCFSTGNLTCHIPEEVEADGLWVECYHWEGLRSYHFVSEEHQRWMPEPVADKPSVEILNAAGYVQMLTRWMKRSKKALIICHGVDIGDQRRGVRSEEDQYKMLGRYNTYYLGAGGQGIAYWCWSDDELSKTYTRQFGYEFGSDTDESKKAYQQAGETMGLVRYDGVPRPVAEKIRQVAEKMAGQPGQENPAEVLVLLPGPVFQSLYRYRANLTAFGVFTSLARQGICAHLAMTSAGENLITAEELAKYRFVILGVSSYTQDHPEVPEVLLRYVEEGGTLFLPLSQTGTLLDAYLKPPACQPCKRFPVARAVTWRFVPGWKVSRRPIPLSAARCPNAGRWKWMSRRASAACS